MRRTAVTLCVFVLVGTGLSTAARAHHHTPIQPGSQMVSPAGCTMNFVFAEPNGVLYIGTAAHCVRSEGQEVRLAGVGRIGDVAWRARGLDFALVRIDNHLRGQVSPAVRHWGGPTGVASHLETLPGTLLYQYGHGIGLGSTEATRPRGGPLTIMGERRYRANVPVIFGDSGSGVITADGRAFGIVTNLGIWSVAEGPTVEAVVDLAMVEKGLRLAVRTAPLRDAVEREQQRTDHIS